MKTNDELEKYFGYCFNMVGQYGTAVTIMEGGDRLSKSGCMTPTPCSALLRKVRAGVAAAAHSQIQLRNLLSAFPVSARGGERLEQLAPGCQLRNR